MSNNNAEISSGMYCCHGYKNRLSSIYEISLSASLLRTHTPNFSYIHCSQIQHCDSLANKKPLYLPFSGTFQQAAFYNIQVKKINKKEGGKTLSLRTGVLQLSTFLWWMQCHKQARRSKMLAVGLAESAPFTASFSFFFCCFAFTVWRIPFFTAPLSILDWASALQIA